MYGELKSGISTQPEHLEIATKMANEITERYNPTEQNEAIKHIYSLIKERRLCQIKELEERCQFLQQSVQQLG